MREAVKGAILAAYNRVGDIQKRRKEEQLCISFLYLDLLSNIEQKKEEGIVKVCEEGKISRQFH